jgi:DNA-binding MarR family transcriptional regulator
MNKDELEVTARNLAELTFRLLASCHEKEERLAKSHNLTQAEFRCLKSMQEGEIINNREIANRLRLSASRLTRIIDGLVQKGFVVREIDPLDRRNMRLYLSPKGVEFVKKMNDDYTQIHKEILENIEKDQHEPLIQAMTNLLSALEKWISKS